MAPSASRPSVHRHHRAHGRPISSLKQSQMRAIHGVLVSPHPANSVGQCHDAVLDRQKIDVSDTGGNAWKDLSLPAILGLPLQFVKWPTTKGGANYNHLVQVLSIDADCSRAAGQLEEAGFGQTSFGTIRGGILLVRRDGRTLREKDVETLSVYNDTHLTEIIEFGGGRWKHKTIREVEELQERMKEKLTPEAFVKFWGEYAEMKVEAGVKEWKGLECPVKVESGRASAKQKDKEVSTEPMVVKQSDGKWCVSL